MEATTYSEALELAAHNFKKSGLVSEIHEAQDPKTGKYYYILAPKGHIINGNFTPLQ